ncbi:MAG: bifunctional riboflavin kinase/FAD synthetase [Gammaproteobacteria bacterium]|nr:bifunctional riboflavin kinase/FAD synthetase [Gammaproteobacteria bacterium]
MELIRGLHNLRERHRGCVLSIGNFDGFHRGHQALIARLQEHAARAGLPPAVLTFEPTPREYFGRQGREGRVATFRDKLKALSRAGVARVLCVRFDRRFAAMPAECFVEDLLVARLGAKAVVVGDDFRFGAGRGGDIGLLRRMGERAGFVAESLGTVEEDGVRCSSSALRERLAVPDLDAAARMLGRPYALSGRVRPGLRLGRKLGFPTANVALRRKPALRLGVYAVRARVAGGPPRPGVANLGVRPTLGMSRCLLETHLFDNPGDLYGRELEVEFVRFLRAEQRFESLERLAEQIERDRRAAQDCFKELAQSP